LLGRSSWLLLAPVNNAIQVHQLDVLGAFFIQPVVRATDEVQMDARDDLIKLHADVITRVVQLVSNLRKMSSKLINIALTYIKQ